MEKYADVEKYLDKLNTEFPDQLRKSILQEAVQGKLVPQDPTDEPVSVLLERIRAEKQHLVKEGKIKKDKHESVIFRRDNSHYEKLDVLRKFALMMKFLLKYQRIGVGQGWEVIWTFVMEHTTPLSMFLKVSLL